MSSLSPNLINERDRRTEVARLLALGILRRKIRLNRQKEATHPSNSLDLRDFPSVHAHDEEPKIRRNRWIKHFWRVWRHSNMPPSELKALWRDVYQDEPPGGHKSHMFADWLIACRSLLMALIRS